MSATNRGAVRNERDFYPTPLSAFEPLIPYLPPLVWEPACGDGRLVEAMWGANIGCIGSDIEPQREQDDREDFLAASALPAPAFKCIVTNPPFSLAFEFCKHAVQLAEEVFFLLPLNFLASAKRREWFRKNEPSAIFVLSKRPSFTGKGTDACDYGWMYWGPCHRGIFHL